MPFSDISYLRSSRFCKKVQIHYCRILSLCDLIGFFWIFQNSPSTRSEIFLSKTSLEAFGLTTRLINSFHSLLSKGLRREYDNDDCWQYSIIRDRYECDCAAQCNNYVGSAASTMVSMSLLAVSTMFSIIYGLRY